MRELASVLPLPYPLVMDLSFRLKRLKFRAWHRGTREADYLIGGFFDRFHATWSDEQIAWFEALLDEDDPPVLAWALQTEPVPERFAGEMMTAMQKLDYVELRR